MTTPTLPKLITFDGEARSGKGTIVQRTKDYLRDECGYKVMLIDRGQTFRVLVVAATQANVDLDDTEALDAFLRDEANATACLQLVKTVYGMTKPERDALLYTNEVGAKSAKVGARPASQDFVAMLTKKWLRDAGKDGFEVVLIDGRALENIAIEMHDEGLCDYRMGLYFICDVIVGARRTLGFAQKTYEELSETEKAEVDVLVAQINERNERDRNRTVERLLPPSTAKTYVLPNVPTGFDTATRPMAIFDTSADLTPEAMSQPVAAAVANVII